MHFICKFNQLVIINLKIVHLIIFLVKRNLSMRNNVFKLVCNYLSATENKSQWLCLLIFRSLKRQIPFHHGWLVLKKNLLVKNAQHEEKNFLQKTYELSWQQKIMWSVSVFISLLIFILYQYFFERNWIWLCHAVVSIVKTDDQRMQSFLRPLQFSKQFF